MFIHHYIPKQKSRHCSIQQPTTVYTDDQNSTLHANTVHFFPTHILHLSADSEKKFQFQHRINKPPSFFDDLIPTEIRSSVQRWNEIIRDVSEVKQQTNIVYNIVFLFVLQEKNERSTN